FFFFQAEDGIRDFHVTGVQTCALPIYAQPAAYAAHAAHATLEPACLPPCARPAREKPPMMRHERLRFWLAGLAAAAAGWLCYAGLAELAGALGVATWLPYPAPRRQWLLIGESWQWNEFSGAIADASVFLAAL